MMKTRDAGGKQEHRPGCASAASAAGNMITGCKWCRRGRRGPWWQRTSASKCPPWREHGQKWTTKTRRYRERKQKRQPVQKIGNDRNHSGALGAQFAPPPAAPKQEVIVWDVFLPFFPQEKSQFSVINWTFMFSWVQYRIRNHPKQSWFGYNVVKVVLNGALSICNQAC